MSKATHNGTCQVCGRLQAVRGNSKLAKHGYTTIWGYFNGTCRGSDEKPLEQSTAVLDMTAKDLAEEGNNLLAQTPAHITAVSVPTGHGYYVGKNYTRDTIELTEANLATAQAGASSAESWRYRTWPELVAIALACRRAMGKGLLAHADFLKDLRDRVHGQPLCGRL